MQPDRRPTGRSVTCWDGWRPRAGNSDEWTTYARMRMSLATCFIGPESKKVCCHFHGNKPLQILAERAAFLASH